MIFKKRKKDGLVLNMENFEEYKKGRKAVVKAKTEEKNKVTSLENEVAELKQLVHKLIEAK